MEKIVKDGLKIDFHIHSIASSHKDGQLVSNNTVDNLNVLISGLINNQVNMAAITDHDNFDYDLYTALKLEEGNENCIKKILPGVEFTVTIESKELHIITLFDDENNDRIASIQSLIFDSKSNKPKYDLPRSFSENKYLEILREINTNVILICHQKESLSSISLRKHDAMNLGQQKLEELIFLDYFEAFEFKNKRNEIFNKDYLAKQKNHLKGMKFITGSDCHERSKYSTISTDKNFNFTYLKCLPTFRGLMMAVTGFSRIKVGVNSFFSAKAPVKNIELNINENKYDLEMSRGINVIIGDNSIGKSLLLHNLTNFNYLDNASIKKGYGNYLKNNNIKILTRISKEEIFRFDKQGNIRDLFNSGKTNGVNFLEKYFPPSPNYGAEKSNVLKMIHDFVRKLKSEDELKESVRALPKITFELLEDESSSLQITSINSNNKNKLEEFNNLIDDIKQAKIFLEKIKNYNFLDINDVEKIETIEESLDSINQKYTSLKKELQKKDAYIAIINKCLTELDCKLQATKTDKQKKIEKYKESFLELTVGIKNIIRSRLKEPKYKFDIIDLKPEIETYGKYKFISKAHVDKIDEFYFIELLKKPLSSTYKKKFDIKNYDIDDFKRNINRLQADTGDIFNDYENEIKNYIENDFKIKNIITIDNGDINESVLSNGANATIYFDLLSLDNSGNGVYIIDQPEDDISQKAIKNEVLKDFKKLSENRQIIMITHNPQFIVNLDVDNVIYLKKEENNSISIEYGALEYKDEKTNILKIIVDNIEGGIDALKERYKKYEKSN